VYQSHYEHLERGCRHRSADLAQLAESSEAPRHRSFDVLPHRQVCVSVNAEITDGPRRGDWDANDRYRSGWQLMLTPTCCSPDGLGFVRVQHQPVLPRPVHSVNGAVGNLRWERVDCSRRTWAIDLNVISIEVRRQSMAFDQLDQVYSVEDKHIIGPNTDTCGTPQTR